MTEKEHGGRAVIMEEVVVELPPAYEQVAPAVADSIEGALRMFGISQYYLTHPCARVSTQDELRALIYPHFCLQSLATARGGGD
jgi:hypothetical protein